jgi:hypothetical protein
MLLHADVILKPTPSHNEPATTKSTRTYLAHVKTNVTVVRFIIELAFCSTLRSPHTDFISRNSTTMLCFFAVIIRFSWRITALICHLQQRSPSKLSLCITLLQMFPCDPTQFSFNFSQWARDIFEAHLNRDLNTFRRIVTVFQKADGSATRLQCTNKDLGDSTKWTSILILGEYFLWYSYSSAVDSILQRLLERATGVNIFVSFLWSILPYLWALVYHSLTFTWNTATDFHGFLIFTAFSYFAIFWLRKLLVKLTDIPPQYAAAANRSLNVIITLCTTVLLSMVFLYGLILLFGAPLSTFATAANGGSPVMFKVPTAQDLSTNAIHHVCENFEDSLQDALHDISKQSISYDTAGVPSIKWTDASTNASNSITARQLRVASRQATASHTRDKEEQDTKDRAKNVTSSMLQGLYTMGVAYSVPSILGGLALLLMGQFRPF